VCADDLVKGLFDFLLIVDASSETPRRFRVYLSLKIITCSECGIKVINFRLGSPGFILSPALDLSMILLWSQRRLSLFE
jgi:hypothetical protein